MEPAGPTFRSTRSPTNRVGERHSLGRLAADELRRAILGGRYKPGERLVEDRLENMRGGDMHGPDRTFDMNVAFGAGCLRPDRLF